MAEYTGPYKNTVILNNDSLNKIVELTKHYCVAGEGTGIKLKPGRERNDTTGPDRLLINNALTFESTLTLQETNQATETDLNHPACIKITDNSYKNPEVGAGITYLLAGSLLEFSPSTSKEKRLSETEYNDLVALTPKGSFTVIENNGTKAHLVTVRGFDTSGSFTDNMLITNTSDATRNPSYGGSLTASDLGMSASIVTYGGIDAAKSIKAYKIHAAVFNDYAEYRNTADAIPGECVIECGDGSMKRSTERLQAGANIVSDTFGFSIGETDLAKTPIAVCGRVLAYPTEDRQKYKAGDAVCSAPDGKVSLMTREEIKEWPDRIVGYVSEIPSYEKWGSNEVAVNGRIWIKIK